MDLSREIFEAQGFGSYERLDPGDLPSLYLAYKPSLGKVSGRVLDPVREGFENGDPDVLSVLRSLASLAEQGKEALQQGDGPRFKALMDENFDLRRRIMPISEENLSLVRSARACGASAKFAGSGGSIIGIYDGEEMFRELAIRLGRQGAVVTTPVVT
jgi:glucuronokinase